ncbi:uncharacterized protein JCM10292_003679 [Rhodotorula paludigena]|uniref:uncharacterized protein n=1 Tax=Rhodotorula paludigena TaxID=86838 RepID=UPI00317BB25F
MVPAPRTYTSPFPEPDARLLSIAEQLKPELIRTELPVRNVVEVVADDASLLGWKAVPAAVPLVEDLPLQNTGKTFVLDVGEHIAGYLTFDVAGMPFEKEPADAPARIKLTFGEVLNDIAEPFEPYNGFLAKSWLPEETVVLQRPHYKPTTMRIQNRYAFRYIKVEVIATSIRFGLHFTNVTATAVTSVSRQNPPELTFTSGVAASLGLTAEEKDLLLKIDAAAHTTLRNCMHTVYEDGPRRDQRLWIGDLRLQALANYETFRDRDLVKRCLYLFAAMPFNDEGLLCACAYEEPEPHTGGNSIVDYALLFTNTLLDYVKFSGDTAAGEDLFDIALEQFNLAARRIGSDFLYNVPVPKSLLGGEEWHFIDWQEKLHKSTGFQCIFIFCLNALVELSQVLGKPEPSIQLPQGSLPASKLASELRTAIRKAAFDGEKFVSGPDKQLSWASNAWAVLAGVHDSQEEAQKALRIAYESKDSVIANTPYLHHYLCEAFIKAGLSDLALKHILHYWGSMIRSGGTTFFECWIPSNPRFSPYGSFASQSFCHAWSCTPSLLLRQLGLA